MVQGFHTHTSLTPLTIKVSVSTDYTSLAHHSRPVHEHRYSATLASTLLASRLYYSFQAIGLIYDKRTCLLDVWLQPSEREIFRGPCCLPHKCQAFMAPLSLSLKAAELTSPDLHGLGITWKLHFKHFGQIYQICLSLENQTNPISGLFRSLFSVVFERTTSASDGDRSFWGSKLWERNRQIFDWAPPSSIRCSRDRQPLTTPPVTTAVMLLGAVLEAHQPATRQTHLRRTVQLREATAVPGRKTGPRIMDQSPEPSSVYRVFGPTTTVTGIAAAADANVRSEKKTPLAQAYLPVQQSHVGWFGKGIDSERSKTTQKVEPGKLLFLQIDSIASKLESHIIQVGSQYRVSMTILPDTEPRFLRLRSSSREFRLVNFSSASTLFFSLGNQSEAHRDPTRPANYDNFIGAESPFARFTIADGLRQDSQHEKNIRSEADQSIWPFSISMTDNYRRQGQNRPGYAGFEFGIEMPRDRRPESYPDTTLRSNHDDIKILREERDTSIGSIVMKAMATTHGQLFQHDEYLIPIQLSAFRPIIVHCRQIDKSTIFAFRITNAGLWPELLRSGLRNRKSYGVLSSDLHAEPAQHNRPILAHVGSRAFKHARPLAVISNLGPFASRPESETSKSVLGLQTTGKDSTLIQRPE
ncbi:uncharacterized protein CLUP02_10585 [Colletotrichum lupini]|uniref:Uncharacterized protein n=1 Tax=Colletotrichum lupini TaxID=145971 RepID=A0A9Q8WIX3_9PEZI|nr:uncharacterized protein CLUP02_10585 [Colletotrichum lupini]UQC85089.1 hypothetical protein CLUP02_10585 [Colletotrichum lupini]